MRLAVFSDLHNEIYRSRSKGRERAPLLEIKGDFDVLVLAGDIDEREHSAAYAALHADYYQKPVILVPGNHEYWGGRIGRTLEKIKARAADHNVHVLDNEVVEIGGTRFIGATLWTDGLAYGRDKLHDVVAALEPSSRYDEGMWDYRKIRDSQLRRLKPSALFALHNISRSFIGSELAKSFAGDTVLVTHHAPLLESLPEDREGDIFNAAYASDLSDLLKVSPPAMCIHGHIHEPVNYQYGGSRVFSNPAGGPDGLLLAQRRAIVEVGYDGKKLCSQFK